MTTIKAVVRNGGIELDKPIDLPDGTELSIPLPNGHESLGMREEDWKDTPEAAEAWIRWYDALDPLEFKPEERAAWEAARKDEREFELALWKSRSDRMEGLFP